MAGMVRLQGQRLQGPERLGHRTKAVEKGGGIERGAGLTQPPVPVEKGRKRRGLEVRAEHAGAQELSVPQGELAARMTEPVLLDPQDDPLPGGEFGGEGCKGFRLHQPEHLADAKGDALPVRRRLPAARESHRHRGRRGRQAEVAAQRGLGPVAARLRIVEAENPAAEGFGQEHDMAVVHPARRAHHVLPADPGNLTRRQAQAVEHHGHRLLPLRRRQFRRRRQ